MRTRYVKISKFLNLLFRRYEFLNFWILAIYGHTIRIVMGGSTRNFFWEVFASRLTFWVSFSPIGESADFTILCGETLSILLVRQHFSNVVWYGLSLILKFISNTRNDKFLEFHSWNDTFNQLQYSLKDN